MKLSISNKEQSNGIITLGKQNRFDMNGHFVLFPGGNSTEAETDNSFPN